MHNQEYSLNPNKTREDGTLFIHYGDRSSPFKSYEQNTEEISHQIEEEKYETIQNDSSLMKSESKKILRNNSFLIPKDINFSEITTQFLEKNNEDLLKIFQYYCSLGEPMNTGRMKSIKFKKILKDANILNV